MSSITIDSNVPWQTNEKQVGAFAYFEGLPKKGCVKGFAYTTGSGSASKAIDSLDAYWQTALVAIELHLEEARAIIRQNRRIFHIRDPFADSCRVLNTSWIPKVNDELREAESGYAVDCVPVAVVGGGSSHRVHYVFIRVISAPGVARGVGAAAPLSSPFTCFQQTGRPERSSQDSTLRSSHTSKSDYKMPARSEQDLLVGKVGPLATTAHLTEYLRKREESNRTLRGMIEQVEQNKDGQTAEIAELEQQLRKERMKTAVQEGQIKQVGAKLREQAHRNDIQAQGMEDLIKQLRQERLQKEEQAEEIGRLERRVKEMTAELEFLRYHVTMDNCHSTHSSAEKVSKKVKKKKKKKDKKSDSEKSKEKTSKKKKGQQKVQEDDGIMLHISYDPAKEDEAEPVIDPTETEEVSTSSAPCAFQYPPAIGIEVPL
eukprot:scaffold2102_cov161-Amphora_coffeaeformis.AAC.25